MDENLFQTIKAAIVKQGIWGEISCIMKIGSSIFFDDPVDIDYLVLVKNSKLKDLNIIKIQLDNEQVLDLFVVGEYPYKLKIENFEFFKFYESLFLMNVLDLYQNNIIYGIYPEINMNFFEKEYEIKNCMKNVVNAFFLLDPIKNRRIVNGFLPKYLYNYAIILIFFKNNNTLVTNETLNFIKNIRSPEESNSYLVNWFNDELNTIYYNGGN